MKAFLIAALFLVTSAQAAYIKGSVKSNTRHIPEYGEDQTTYHFYTNDGKILNLPDFVNGMAFPEGNTVIIEADVEGKNLTNIKSFTATISTVGTEAYQRYSGFLTVIENKVVIETLTANIQLPYLFYSKRLLDLNPRVSFKGEIGPGGFVGACENNCHVVSIINMAGITVQFE